MRQCWECPCLRNIWPADALICGGGQRLVHVLVRCSGRMPMDPWAGATRVCGCHMALFPLLTMSYLLAATCSPLLRNGAKSSGLYPLWSTPCPYLKISTQLCPSSWWTDGVRGSLLPSFLMSVCLIRCAPSRCLLFCVKVDALNFLFVCFFTTVLITNQLLSPANLLPYLWRDISYLLSRTIVREPCWMAWPGILAKQGFVFTLSGFKKTEAHLLFPIAWIFFFLLDINAESLADYGRCVTSSRSLAIYHNLSFGKSNYQWRSPRVFWQIEGVKSSNFLVKCNLKPCWGTIWWDCTRAGGRLFN